MHPIISKNSVSDIIDIMQEYLKKGHTILGVCLLDETEDQVVILIDEKPINQEHAKIWWEGYRAALE